MNPCFSARAYDRIPKVARTIAGLAGGEMVLGIERLPEGKKRRRLERALKFLREDYAGKVLDFSEDAAVEWGRLVARARGQGRNLSVLDSQIEAIAVHFAYFGRTVVSSR